MSKDLRTYLAQLEEEGGEDIINVTREVDPRGFDVSAVLQHLEDRGDRRIVRFGKTLDLDGKPTSFSLVYNLFITRELCAQAIGLPRASAMMPLGLEFSRREASRIEPEVMARRHAPVKEVVLTGEAVNMSAIPMFRYHEQDIGQYLTMVAVMKDFDEGFYNVSFCKNMYVGPRKLTVSLQRKLHKHLLNIVEKNEEHDQETPLALVIGHHPAFYLASGALTPFGNDDYGTIGGFLEQPLRLIPSETLGDDFLVPADAEMIIEGFIPPHSVEIENPFGEFSRYYQPQVAVPYMNVTAVMFRKNTIVQGVFPGHAGHFNLGSIPKEGSLYREIKRVFPGVQAVHLPHSGVGRYSCYVSIKKRREEDGKLVGTVPHVHAHQMQFVVVVDDDVDVFDEQDVVWAVVTRARFQEDINLLKGMPRSDRVIIDATVPLNEPFPKKALVPREALENCVLEKWICPKSNG
ncbi:MAG: UbiD family decarboxylase domain-containing protein [Candidatus Binatia bacterium]